jgi:hypothetical protein
MHICFKIIKSFYYTLRCSTCFGHYCVHHQEPSTTAPTASGYRVVLCWLRPPALFWCYCSKNRTGLEDATETTPHGNQRLYVQWLEAPNNGHSVVRNM